MLRVLNSSLTPASCLLATCRNHFGSRAGSVTGVVHRYTPPFDADAAILSMMQSRRWPRPGYLVRRLGRACPQRSL